MSHTLHREGSIESLSKDFVVLAMPRQGYTEGSGEKLRAFMDLAQKHNPVNLGNSKAGNIFNLPNGYADVRSRTKDGGICHAVLKSPEDVQNFLVDLKEADLGLSIVVSGLFETVGECCHKAGLNPHSVNMSLGIFGKTEKLVPDAEREVTTMCGHGMVTGDLVLGMVNRIKKGAITPHKASEELCALCVCGIFNVERCAELLLKMSKA